MIYYNSYEYNERYYVRFADIAGNQWKISIQDPLFEGTATELTGGAFPVMWEGVGDESQEKVVLGSTGKISLICLAGQENLFTYGAILPRIINDRRVQVLRYVNSDWAIVWQGFIKPNTYSQDWDRTPFEIELPIVSTIAATEFFPMPSPNDNVYGLFEEQTNIAGLLRAIIISLGCYHLNIITNKFLYEDFNGNTQIIPIPGASGTDTYSAHWTQGVVSSMFYYNVDSGIMKPKTFKDVLENIFYPYGKIQEYELGLGIAFLMRWKDDANNNSRLYSISVWDNYETQVIGTGVRFGDFSPLYHLSLSDINTAGTDNTYSLIPRPKSVSFTNEIDKNENIFELSENFIKSSLPLGISLSGKPIETAPLNGLTRFLYAIDKKYINLEFGSNWVFENSQNPSFTDLAFCRVVEVTGDSADNVSYAVSVPLGFSFNLYPDSPNSYYARVAFTLANGVRSKQGMNVIKMSLKCFYIFGKQPINGTEISPLVGSTDLYFKIYDTTVSQYLTYQNGQWGWSNTDGGYIAVNNLDFTTNESILRFNEPRANGDSSLHFLRFDFKVVSNSFISDVPTYGSIFTQFNLEYENVKVLYNDLVACTFAKSITKNGNSHEYGGSGEDLIINFETMCGKTDLIIDGSILLPYNSFCNAQTYIDTQDREKIQIEAAQFETYYWSGYFNLATAYAVVTDGEKVYIPVAVGMNPRMNTLKLTLVSTNVTSS